MISQETRYAKDVYADIVVIGGGGAGMSAAIAAAEKGARVIILEKRGLGGNSALAYSIFGADSPVIKRTGAICPRDECFKLAMDWAHWRINPRIIRNFIDRSGDTIQWLEEMGVEFDEDIFKPGQFFPVHLIKGNGSALIKALKRICQELGVRIFIHTPARKILMDDMKRVIGVLATRGKEEITVAAKNIIIATGGFAGNKRWLKKYCPDYHENMERIGIAHNGDGLRMAWEVGAATEGLGTMLLGMPSKLHPLVNTSADNDGPPSLSNLGLISIASEPRTIRINKQGQRYLDECTNMGENATVRQTDNVCYTLFDTAFVRAVAEKGTFQTMSPLHNVSREGEFINPILSLEKDLLLFEQRGLVKIHQSWDAIADQLDVNYDSLKETLDEYNADCAQKYDHLFNKDARFLIPLSTPPYYSIEWQTTYIVTMGGIKINEKTEVLGLQDQPIPGLYAAGVDSGGWESSTYCWQIPGHALGFSLVSGRIAGENAAGKL